MLTIRPLAAHGKLATLVIALANAFELGTDVFGNLLPGCTAANLCQVGKFWAVFRRSISALYACSAAASAVSWLRLPFPWQSARQGLRLFSCSARRCAVAPKSMPFTKLIQGRSYPFAGNNPGLYRSRRMRSSRRNDGQTQLIARSQIDPGLVRFAIVKRHCDFCL